MTINPSRSKDITVLNDDQHPKGKSLDNHPITKPQLEPERMSHLDEELHPNLPIVAGPHSGDIELVKLILEDNQRLRETNINLTKRFPSSSTNYEDHESFTSHSPGGRNKTKSNPPLLAQKRKKRHGDNGHDLRKEPVGVDNKGFKPQGSESQRVNAFLRIGTCIQNKEAWPPR